MRFLLLLSLVFWHKFGLMFDVSKIIIIVSTNSLSRTRAMMGKCDRSTSKFSFSSFVKGQSDWCFRATKGGRVYLWRGTRFPFVPCPATSPSMWKEFPIRKNTKAEFVDFLFWAWFFHREVCTLLDGLDKQKAMMESNVTETSNVTKKSCNESHHSKKLTSFSNETSSCARTWEFGSDDETNPLHLGIIGFSFVTSSSHLCELLVVPTVTIP